LVYPSRQIQTATVTVQCQHIKAVHVKPGGTQADLQRHVRRQGEIAADGAGVDSHYAPIGHGYLLR
jgi:hypothetical protein